MYVVLNRGDLDCGVGVSPCVVIYRQCCTMYRRVSNLYCFACLVILLNPAIESKWNSNGLQCLMTTDRTVLIATMVSNSNHILFMWLSSFMIYLAHNTSFCYELVDSNVACFLLSIYIFQIRICPIHAIDSFIKYSKIWLIVIKDACVTSALYTW